MARGVVLLTFNAHRFIATRGSVKSGMARCRDGASHSATIFHVLASAPGSLKLYMPSAGIPRASAGLAVPRATRPITAAAVKLRELLIFGVLQRTCAGTTDSAVLWMRLGQR